MRMEVNAYEAEERLWNERMKTYRHPSHDFRRGFRPLGGRPADFAVVWHLKRLHCFYIEHRLIEETGTYPGHTIFFGHASTGDLLSWEVHDPVMLVRPGTWESAHVWAPHIIRHEGRFMMAYTGVNDKGSQNIGLAFSDDLFDWRRSETNPISPLAEADWAFWRDDSPASCRDPHLNYWDGVFWMNYTACTRKGETCIALASSSDLLTWVDHGPILIGGDRFRLPLLWHIESSALIHSEGRWVLSASEEEGVRYWESANMQRFDYEQGRCLWASGEGHIFAAELVWCHNKKWLMLACSMENADDLRTTVLRFGEVDWTVENPHVTVITELDAIKCWMGRIRDAVPHPGVQQTQGIPEKGVRWNADIERNR